MSLLRGSTRDKGKDKGKDDKRSLRLWPRAALGCLLRNNRVGRDDLTWCWRSATALPRRGAPRPRSDCGPGIGGPTGIYRSLAAANRIGTNAFWSSSGGR